MRTAFTDVGKGLPVLFVHGFPHNKSLWSNQLDALRDNFRCIAPDLRGFGESESSPPFSIDQYADDMAALLTDLDISGATIVGLSMGGYVGLALWRRHPHLVRAMVLADTRSGADSDEGKQKRDGMILMARTQGSAAIADAHITGMLGKTTRESSPEVVARVHAMLAAAPVEGIVGGLQAMRDRADSTPLLGTINIPALIVVGAEDVLTPPKESQLMHEKIPGSELQIIPGAGHLSNVEQPLLFNQFVADFLARVS